jgi:hypothetical protein
MTERLVRTHNIFIDTAKARVESRTKGDDFALHLNTMAVDAEAGQFIRLTLNNFAMVKSWTDVNENNDTLTIGFNNSLQGTAILSHQNYKNISDLANNFATILGNFIVTNTPATAFTVNDLAPASTTTINGTTDNIISFRLNFTGSHGITNLQVFGTEESGESAMLLGGDMYSKAEAIAKVTDVGDTTSSFNISVTATDITVTGLYPAQRFTEPYVYVRTSLPTSATETASITAVDAGSVPEANSSNILAKIAVNTEMVVFNSQTGREYFLDLRQKHLNNIQLYLTDSKNRRLGRTNTSGHINTATGTGTNQSTRGNLNFNAVFRVEIIKELGRNEVSFGPAEPSKRFNNLLIDPSKKPF